MASQHPTRRRAGGGPSVVPPPPGPPEIPDKLYFRIGEVARLCAVPTYVLRFWESEIPQLHPNKGGTGQRLYRRRDVEVALRIKCLLYEQGYTIPGAIQVLKSEARATRDSQLGLGGIAPAVEPAHLLTLQRDLRDLLALLSQPPQPRSALAPVPIRAPRASRALTPPVPFPAPRTDSLFPEE